MWKLRPAEVNYHIQDAAGFVLGGLCSWTPVGLIGNAPFLGVVQDGPGGAAQFGIFPYYRKANNPCIFFLITRFRLE